MEDGVEEMPLSVGSSIEVLWEVETGGGDVNEVWWQATVMEIGEEPEPGEGRKLGCRILYEAGYGHSMAEVSAYITRDGALWEQGRENCHIWRSCATAYGVRTGTKRPNEDHDVSWYPNGDEDIEPLQSSRVLKTLERRLKRLEQDSRQHSMEIARVRAGVFPRTEPDESVRPIQFICHFLNEALCKTPLKTATRTLTSDRRRGLPTFSEDCITVSVNCTFGEFEAVCATVSTSEAMGVEFVPSYGDTLVQSMAESDMKVKFPSFHSFLKGIGQLSPARAVNALTTERVDRATKKAGSLRILGGSYLPVSDTKPMMLSIGRACGLDTPVDEKGMVHMLCPESCLWDEEDNYFEHPFSECSMGKEEWMAKYAPLQDDSVESCGGHIQKCNGSV